MLLLYDKSLTVNLILLVLLTHSCLIVSTFDYELCPQSCSCLGALVDCSKRRLSAVPNHIPKWCEILELAHNSLYNIDSKSFNELIYLIRLDLSYTQIKQLDNNLFVSSNTLGLQDLKLNNNLLTQFPQFIGLSALTSLVIHHNNINSLFNVSTQMYVNLRQLDLSYNQINSLPATLFSNISNKITTINLSNNRIVNIEKGSFDSLINLETLRLSKNRIGFIPKELFRKLHLLKELDLSRNRLESLEGLIFHGLESLQTLKLRRNGLSQLFDGVFWGLNSIQSLHIDYNNITKVRKGWLYGLSSLNQLSISYNQIDAIDGDGWEFSRKLWDLDISHNKLHSLTRETFSRLHSLQYLSLDHNLITFIDDGAFSSLTTLEVLELSFNEISWTIEDSNGAAFVGLSKLKTLGLASNRIKSIANRAFSGLKSLEILDLTHNPITSIQDESFSYFTNLQELRLNTSDLLCDCTLKWLPLWIQKLNNKQALSDAKCKHPEWLFNKTLIDANHIDFTCQDYLKPYLIDDFKLIADKPLQALKGDNMTLLCRAASSSTTHMTFQWRKDNLIMNISMSRVYMKTFENQINDNVIEYNNHLHLTNIEDNDEGRYQCIASNNFGAVYTHKIRINVLVKPQFSKIPSNITVKVGNTARLECAAKGQPMPEISWQKDGGDNFPAAMERRMHVMPTDDVFFIVEVKVTDMGKYTCTATNEADSIVANAFLNVLEMPTFVRPMNDKEALSGETAVLECMSSGSPKPSLTWSKDGGAIIATERHFFTADNQLLIIVKTQTTDGGEYSCEMSNILGSVKGSSYLNIISVMNSNEIEKDDNNSFLSLSFMSIEDGKTIGIIIIAVFLCIVFTSLVWVVIIYNTRKRGDDYTPTNSDETHASEFDAIKGLCANPSDMQEDLMPNIYVDDNKNDDNASFNSDLSTKDSGTGDSARRDSHEIISEQFNRNSFNKPTKLVLLKGLSMDHISAKRNSKRSNSKTPNYLTDTCNLQQIKSYSVGDIISINRNK